MQESEFNDYPTWHDADNQPIACEEKIKVLRENYRELYQQLQDCFEDALLMQCDEQEFRTILHALVEKLVNPYRGR